MKTYIITNENGSRRIDGHNEQDAKDRFVDSGGIGGNTRIDDIIEE